MTHPDTAPAYAHSSSSSRSTTLVAVIATSLLLLAFFVPHAVQRAAERADVRVEVPEPAGPSAADQLAEVLTQLRGAQDAEASEAAKAKDLAAQFARQEADALARLDKQRAALEAEQQALAATAKQLAEVLAQQKTVLAQQQEAQKQQQALLREQQEAQKQQQQQLAPAPAPAQRASTQPGGGQAAAAPATPGGPCANYRPRALVSLLGDRDAPQHVAGTTALYKSALRHAPGYFGAWELLMLRGRSYSNATLTAARLAGWRLRFVEPLGQALQDSALSALHAWDLEQYSEVVFVNVTAVFVGRVRGSFATFETYRTPCKLWAPRALQHNGTWSGAALATGVFALRPNATEGARLRARLAGAGAGASGGLAALLGAAYTKASGDWCELDFEKAANAASFGPQRALWDAAARGMQVIDFPAPLQPWLCANSSAGGAAAASGSSGATPDPALCALWAAEAGAGTHPVTVVTAFYPGRAKHTLEEYAEWARSFLIQPVPILLFTPNVSAMPGADYLPRRPPGLTRVVELAVPDFLASHRSFDWEMQLKMDYEKQIHSVHLFHIWGEKPALVARAIDINPFNSSHYVWVDFGLFRTNLWSAGNWTIHAGRFATRDRVTMLDVPINYPPKLVAGGVYGGTVRAWQRYAHASYITLVREMRLPMKHQVGDDQRLMTFVVNEHPELVCRIVANVSTVPDKNPWWYMQWYLAGIAPETPGCAEDFVNGTRPPLPPHAPEPDFACDRLWPSFVEALPLELPSMPQQRS